MKSALQGLLSSKKFLILATGIAVTLLITKFGWDEATANKVVGLFVTYLGAQGLADMGKGKAQVEGEKNLLAELATTALKAAAAEPKTDKEAT
jgi:hypothetical protein